MKNFKTILIAIFLLQSVISFGQTKEETVKYIDDILEVSNGYYGNIAIDLNWRKFIKSQEFSLSNVTIETFLDVNIDDKRQKKIIYTNIPWSTMKKNQIDEKMDTSSSVICIKITFEGQLKLKTFEEREDDFFRII